MGKKEKNDANRQWIKEAKAMMKKDETERTTLLDRMRVGKPEKAAFIENFIIQEMKNETEKSEKEAVEPAPKKPEEIPVLTVTPEKEKLQTEQIIEKTEAIKKEEKRIKVSKVIEMIETKELKKTLGIELYTLEKLKENGANRMTPGKMVSFKKNEIVVDDKTFKLPHSKIGDKVTSTFKISTDKGVPIRFLAIVPGKIVGRTKHINRKGNQPAYDLVMLIPENIPPECDRRVEEGVTKILRVNGNARDGLKPVENGYVCEVEVGFKETEKMSEVDPDLKITTAVPYVNLFPRSEKTQGLEYVLKILIGPLNTESIKQGSIVVGPSEGLQLLRKESVEAVTLYAILEPSSHVTA